MICPRCSSNVDDRYRLCDRCGAEMPPLNSQSEPAKVPPEQTPPPPAYGYYQQPPVPPVPPVAPPPRYGAPYGYPGFDPNDRPDSLLNLASFFIPILGLVIYFIEKDSKPIRAKAALKWAIISWVIAAVLAFLYFFFVFFMVFMMEMW